ncbi:putative ATP-grasp-modified RiPP [Nonomuraea sp. NPDC048916]|uniref:putative ATP-grasp-modified RiPP n=1 Tax=Nonomuraea sp. NPDC048916 TaxID=3154232 RepID=UPI0033E5D1B3
MALTQDQPVRPWGMSRATKHWPEASLPWFATRLDPDTQLTIFCDEQGAAIDIFAGGSNRTFPTVSMSKPGDGAKNAPLKADDSPNDNEKD